MNPAPPVTRILTRYLPPSLGANLPLAVIPENQAVRLTSPGRGRHLDIVADQGCFDPADTPDRGPPSTVEYSISLSAMTQPAATEVNGPI